jgi:hypothetical protein
MFEFMLTVSILTALFIALVAYRMGVQQPKKITKVDNAERTFGAESTYFHVELKHGGKAQHYLFTASQLSAARNRADRNPEDLDLL